VLAYMGFPVQHRTKLHSTNPLERLNKEVKRRADVVGIFPGEPSITRLIGAVLLEANDEWQLQHRSHGSRTSSPDCVLCDAASPAVLGSRASPLHDPASSPWPFQAHIRSALLSAVPQSRLRRARAQEDGAILHVGC
jgi:hypothetical protein